MSEEKLRTRRTFSKEKKRTRKNVVFELSPDVYEIFIQKPNYGEFLSKLIEEHYDENIIKVAIDEKIIDAYNNDPYKDFRIPMLLIDFYLKGNHGTLNNNNSLSSNIYNEDYCFKDKEDNTSLIKNNIITEEVELSSGEDIISDDDVSNVKEIVEQSLNNIDDNKNVLDSEDIKVFKIDENKSIEDNLQYSQSTKDISSDKERSVDIEVKKKIEEKKENENSSSNDSAKNSKISGSLMDIMPTNNKSLI